MEMKIRIMRMKMRMHVNYYYQEIRDIMTLLLLLKVTMGGR